MGHDDMMSVALEEVSFVRKEIIEIKTCFDETIIALGGGGLPYNASDESRSRLVAAARNEARKLEDRMEVCTRMLTRVEAAIYVERGRKEN